MKHLLSAVLLVLLLGCSAEPDSGPGKIRWDREVCTRCAMSVSEHNYAAQIRHKVAGQKSKLYVFDDIGCAIIWLDQQPWKDDPANEIWVAAYQDGQWLDARKAWYVPGKITPMGYGLGASARQEPGAMDFAAARKQVYQVEQQTHAHRGGHSHTGETAQ